MDYRRLGATGLKVSELSLGCMTFGRESNEDESRKMIDKFVEAGGNFLDTANVYAAGASEEILGRVLKHHRRDELVIATKVRFNAKLFTGGKVGPNEWGLSRGHIMAEVENSLRRLQL
jgi:aryl-alcohol dehydrogenase-like predicted oxidoreductase